MVTLDPRPATLDPQPAPARGNPARRRPVARALEFAELWGLTDPHGSTKTARKNWRRKHGRTPADFDRLALILAKRRALRAAAQIATAARTCPPTGRIVAQQSERRRNAASERFLYLAHCARLRRSTTLGHRLYFNFGAPEIAPRAEGNSLRIRRPNRRYADTESSWTAILAPDYLDQLRMIGSSADALARDAGLVVLSVQPAATPDAWRLTVARQGRGFDLVTETGYLVDFGGLRGYGKTIRTARRAAVEPLKKKLLGE
jgi:hypothetical protein